MSHGELPFQMLLIFGSAKLLAELMERFGMPGIVGQIVAGILLGSSVLGLVEQGELLTALSELGVMFLMFRVGLEVKSSELMRIGAPAAMIAIAGVVVPFGLGWAIARLWGFVQIEAVFIATAMVATSVGITAQVLADKGLLQERASRLILAAAIIDDVLGLIVLAVVSGVASGPLNVTALAVTSIVAISFTLIVATWGTRAMRAVVPRVEENFRVSEAQFALAICLLFGLAGLAAFAGVAAIIGAFLAGMALSEHVNHRVHDLTNGVAELLIPFFLVGIGLHFDLGVFANPATITLAVVVFVAAVLSKFVGCGLAALPFGRADAVRVGIGMVPRGEVGMVVAQLGLGMAIISQQTFAIVVFMAVTTTLVAPPLLNRAYKGLIRPTEVQEYRIG